MYVLHLERATERLGWIEAETARAGIEAILVPAVDGQALSPRRLRPLMRNRSRHAMSPQEAAITLSHRRALRRFLASGADHAIILEDDTRLGTDFRRLTHQDWTVWPFDVVKLETMLTPAWTSRAVQTIPGIGRQLARLRSTHLGAAAYLVSRRGAQRILAITQCADEPIDHAIFGDRILAGNSLDVLQLTPAIAIQDAIWGNARGSSSLPSYLENKRGIRIRTERRSWRRLWHNIRKRSRKLAVHLYRRAFMARQVVRFE